MSSEKARAALSASPAPKLSTQRARAAWEEIWREHGAPSGSRLGWEPSEGGELLLKMFACRSLPDEQALHCLEWLRAAHGLGSGPGMPCEVQIINRDGYFDEWPAQVVAARYGRPLCMLWLVDHAKACPTEAFRFCALDQAKDLLDRGADISSRDDASRSDLMCRVACDPVWRPELAQRFWDAGHGVGGSNLFGVSALLGAVERSRLEAIEWLAAHGADFAEQDKRGHSPVKSQNEGPGAELARALHGAAKDKAALASSFGAVSGSPAKRPGL